MHPESTSDVKLQNKQAALAPRPVALLALLVACAFLVVGQLYVTIPLAGEVASRFDVAPASAVLTGSAFGLAYAAGFLVFGPLSDRLGRKPVIVAGLVATALTTALVGSAQSFAVLLAARAVQGLAASTFPPVALSLVMEELPPSHRPFGVSLMSVSFLGAAPLAQFFAANAGGLPTIMLALAPLYLFGAAGLLYAARARSAPAHHVAWNSAGLRALRRDPLVLAAWAAAITVLFGFVSFHGGAQALGPGLSVDLQTLRLAGLPPLLLTFAAAPLTRRHGSSVTARMGLLLAGLGLSLAVIGTPVALVGTSAILSGGVALTVPGLIATVAGRATNGNRGLAFAIYSFCLFLGASFAPPAAQMLAAIGIVPLCLLPAALLAAAALGVSLALRFPPASIP